MQRVLIAGCGDIGRLLGEHYLGRGDVAYGLRRRTDRLPASFQPVPADLTDPSTLNDLPGDLDLVYLTITAGSYSEEDYQRSYVEGTRNLLAALPKQQSPPRLIFVSSTSVYGQQQGEWVDETTPARPAGFSGRCMLEAEQLVEASPFQSVVVRLGGIYGLDRTALLDRVTSGKASLSRGGPWYVNLNHMEDVAGSLIHLAGPENPHGLYLATDGNPPDRNELVTWIADQVGAPEPVVDSESKGGRRRDSNKRCSNQRLLESGYTFRYPDYQSGYRELIAGRAGGD